MNCANCGKLVVSTDYTEDGYTFCNSLCRYTWRQNGKPNPHISSDKDSLHKTLTDFNLDYSLPIPGFEDKEVLIRLSYWVGPKLFIDNKKIRPFKKNSLTKNREYILTSNYGTTVNIKFKHRPLDLVPKVFVDGTEFKLARQLNVWEYIWICLPIILIFIGGILGSLIGTVALYSNSILIRKPRNIFLKYLLPGITSLAAFWFYIQSLGLVMPYLESAMLQLSTEHTLDWESEMLNKQCPIMVDDVTRLDSSSTGLNNKFIYYYTLLNKEKIDTDIEEMKQFLTYQIIHLVKTNEQLKTMRDNEVNFCYNYQDKNFKNLFEITITKDDYK
jgi:hypothetical protein